MERKRFLINDGPNNTQTPVSTLDLLLYKWKNKMKKTIKLIVLLSVAVILAACGSTPQPTVSLPSNTVKADQLNVGFVYIGPQEKATTHINGAACLLCYAVASGLTSSLDTHLENNIAEDELDGIRGLVRDKYSALYASVTDLTLPMEIKKLKKFKGGIGFAQRDFSALKEQLGVDVLVILDISEHGAFRSFSNYIPNGDPQGYVNGLLYAVDLQDNRYIQYQSLRTTVQPPGDWDEPPTFPGVTTSYFQAVEDLKKKLSNIM